MQKAIQCPICHEGNLARIEEARLPGTPVQCGYCLSALAGVSFIIAFGLMVSTKEFGAVYIDIGILVGNGIALLILGLLLSSKRMVLRCEHCSALFPASENPPSLRFEEAAQRMP